MAIDGWREDLLEKCTERIFSGGTPSTKVKEFWIGKNNWLSSGETKNTFITKTEKFISDEAVKNSSTKLALIGDIVIASAGQGNTRGQTSLCKINTYINQSLISLRSLKNKIYYYYLFYNLKNRYSELRKISDGHSIRGSLTIKSIGKMKIIFPPLNEQKAIAKILSDLDEKIEVNNRINEILENMAQEIFKRWFVDFEFPNENGEPYKSSGGEMVDSEFGLIPKGWNITELGEIVKLNYGKSLTSKKRVKGNVDVYGSAGKIGTHNKSLTDEHCIIVGRKGSIGTIYYSKKPSFCIDTTYFFSQKDCEIPLFIAYMLLRSLNLHKYNSDSAVPGLNRDAVYSIKIILPEQNVLKELDNIVKKIYDIIFSNSKQTEILTKLRDTLLPKLMSGEIRVPLDD